VGKCDLLKRRQAPRGFKNTWDLEKETVDDGWMDMRLKLKDELQNVVTVEVSSRSLFVSNLLGKIYGNSRGLSSIFLKVLQSLTHNVMRPRNKDGPLAPESFPEARCNAPGHNG
jgi:hypothetical protein